jgi:hypothetical protein
MELFFFLSSERPAVPFESDPLTNRRYQFLIVPFFAFLKAAQRVQSNVADNCADSQLRFSHLIRRRDLNYVTIIQHHNAPLVSRVIRAVLSRFGFTAFSYLYSSLVTGKDDPTN